jgi:outer membrane murein-binding lipoprotein Lpp
MKKQIYALAVTALMAGTIFTSCQSSTEKVADAKEEVKEAKQELKEERQDANAEAQKAADAEAWRIFKAETEVKIKDNDARIAELKVRKAKPGKVLDPLYAKQIEGLEKRNRDLNARIDNYVPGQTNWEAFKSEFNHDMDELGQALKDLGVDNKK